MRAPYNQGGDAQAIQRHANDYYGSYRNMFEAHGWPERGDKMMPAVQARVVKTYGSVRAFEAAHEPGLVMFPMEAIKGDPPNAWLKSFYGFSPESWGFIGFTQPANRDSFLRRSRPGALVVIYGASRAIEEFRSKVIGILQCSHEIGDARQFMAPDEWLKKQSNPENRDRWNNAIKVVRAWRVMPQSRLQVRDFAPDQSAIGAWQHIGAQGVPLTRREAENILKLDLQEVEVFGGARVVNPISARAAKVFAPSKAGPVSQSTHLMKEAEGPKHLYILKLCGDADAFLGRATSGKMIVKAGFSGNPVDRCDAFNSALPQDCAFQWELIQSGALSLMEPHPTSEHAKAGEREMQIFLSTEPNGCSLGREFFLADPTLVREAWERGNATALAFTR